MFVTVLFDLIHLVYDTFPGSADGVDSDPFMVVLPPTEQWLTEYTVSTVEGISGPFRNYINIIVNSSGTDGLRVEGNPITAGDLWDGVWHVIGTTGYSGGMVAVTPGVHILTHTEANVAFGAISYGHVKYESYGYAGGMRIAPLHNPCQISANVHADG
jgi:hypothetical protein